MTASAPPDRRASPSPPPNRKTQPRSWRVRASLGRGPAQLVDRQEHPRYPGGSLDEIDVDDLPGHVAGKAERGGTEGGRRRIERLATQEHVHPEDGDVVGEREVDGPSGEERQHCEQPGRRVGRGGIEPGEERGPAEEVRIPEGQEPGSQVVPDECALRQVLDCVVPVEEDMTERERCGKDDEGNDEQDDEPGVSLRPATCSLEEWPNGRVSGGGWNGRLIEGGHRVEGLGPAHERRSVPVTPIGPTTSG